MNASISKGPRVIEFVWNTSQGRIRIYKYDLDHKSDAYDVSVETAVYARCYWKNLIRIGFHRIP